MDTHFRKGTPPTSGPVFPTRVCRAQVDRVEKYEDTLTPAKRREEIIKILTAVADRLRRKRAAEQTAITNHN